MPLQIRRGLNAERTQIAPANGLVEGELLYTTDEKKLYIGTGSVGEHQGVVITGYTDSDAKDAAAEILTTGDHVGVGFSYDSQTKQLNATVDLSAFDGPIVADALKGSVFADDSSVLLDAIDKIVYADVVGIVTGNLNGNVIGNVTGDVTGNVAGNVIGNVTGDITGSIFADDSTLLVDGTNGTVPWAVISNAPAFLTEIPGSITADVKGSIFADDSTLLVDAIDNAINANTVRTNTISTVNNLLRINPAPTTGTTVEISGFDSRAILQLKRLSNSDISGVNESILLGSIFFETAGDIVGSLIHGGVDILRLGTSADGTFADDSKFVFVRGGNLGINNISPQEKLDVVGNGIFTGNISVGGSVIGDVVGSLFSDASTMLIDGTDGSLMVANINIAGEIGNTPNNPSSVNSWLEVTVNGATRYIPLYV